MNLNNLLGSVFCFLLIGCLAGCGSNRRDKPGKQESEKPQSVVSNQSKEEIIPLKLERSIEISFSNFGNLLGKSKLLSDKDAFGFGLDTTYWKNYLAQELGEVDGCQLSLVFSVIENQQLGYLVYVKNGKVRKSIECYMDDQVESFRLMSSRIDTDLVLHLEKESSLEGECAYVKMKQDLKSMKSKPVVVEKKCEQTENE